MTPKKDPYTTVCIHCPGGPTRKPNVCFSPGELQRYKPRCRACVSERNARTRPGRSVPVHVKWGQGRTSNAKLTARQAEEIRELAAQQTPRRALAKLFGVSESAISQVITRKTWAAVK